MADELTPTFTVADVLEKAADIIAPPNGRTRWMRGNLHSRDGRFCALGGIEHAAAKLAGLSGRRSLHVYSPRFADARRAASSLTEQAQRALMFNGVTGSVPAVYKDHVPRSVPSWNDNVAKNGREVAQAMRNLAKMLRAEAAVADDNQKKVN